MNTNYFEKVNEKYFDKECWWYNTKYYFQCYYIDDGDVRLMLKDEKGKIHYFIASIAKIQFSK